MPPVVAVAGFAGGTGKSVVAVNVALALAEREPHVVLADLNPVLPVDHVLLGVRRLENEEPVRAPLAFLDYTLCLRCAICVPVCPEGALSVSKSGYPYVNQRLCSGCRTCIIGCEMQAYAEGRKLVGFTYATPVPGTPSLTLVTAKAYDPSGYCSHVVIAARRRAQSLGGVVVVDAGPGAGEGLPMAVKGSRIVVAVVEPSPRGVAELERVASLAEAVGAALAVAVNRVVNGLPARLELAARELGAEMVVTIPYDPAVEEAYATGRPVLRSNPGSPAARALRSLASRLAQLL